MNAVNGLLVVGAVTAALVVWFIVAVWVGTVFGRAMRAHQRTREDEDHEAHASQGTRELDYKRGAP